MTILRTPNRFQPDYVVERFPHLLSFSGAQPDCSGFTEIQGEVQVADLIDEVRKRIVQFDPDADVRIEVVEDKPGAKKRRLFPWRPAMFAAGFAAGVVGELIVRGF